MARPQPGSKLQRDYISVNEVTKGKIADHDNLLRTVSEHTVFSHQMPAVLCLCIQHLIAQTELAIPSRKQKKPFG
jgi:hypothetical protein